MQWAAAHRYPFIGLGTDERAQKRIINAYTEVAARIGYEVGPWSFGQAIHCHVQDSEAHAVRNAQEFMWMAGEFTGLSHPVWSAPSGYLWGAPDSSAAIARRKRTVERTNRRAGALPLRAGSGSDTADAETIQHHRDELTWILGTPDQAVDRIREVLERSRSGIISFYATDGKISHADNMRNIELLGKHVIPAMREIGDELGLQSPFEVDIPVSLATADPADLKPYEFVPVGEPAPA